MNAINTQGYSELPTIYGTLAFAGVVALISIVVAESFLSFSWKTKALTFTVAAAAMVSGCGLIGISKHDRYVLSPDNKPPPMSATVHSWDTGGVLFGGDVFDPIDEFPFDLITMNGKSILTLNKRNNHLIIETLTLFDDNHNVLAKIKDNAIVFIRADTPPPDRPNKSTLTIYDHNDDVAFSVYFRSDKFIEVNGIFRNRSFPLIIDPKRGIFTGSSNGGGYHLSADRFNNHRLVQTDTTMEFYSDVPGTVALELHQK